MIISGLEKIGYILYFRSPDEFYAKLLSGNESITLANITMADICPSKNEICKKSKFIIEHNSDYIFCEILEDLKYDEIFCQILLCNSDIQLKVDYRRLICINSNDIINDEACISFKLHDFFPIFSNSWSCDLIKKLEYLLTYNKYIFQFKSSKTDPSDGRLPIDLLTVIDRQSITEPFIYDKIASRGSDYYKLSLENEISQIFYDRKPKNVRYRISIPLVKKLPQKYEKFSPNKVLNIEAKPFTPNNTKYFTQSVQSIKSESKISPSNTMQNLNGTLNQNQDFNFSTSNTEAAKINTSNLTSNIVNMFSQMYRNCHAPNKKSASIPFSKYKSVFPAYGGVNFAESKKLTPLIVTSCSTNKIPSLSTSNNLIPTTYNTDSTLSPKRESSSPLDKISFGKELRDLIVEIKSIPLPETTTNAQISEPMKTTSYIISAAPVMYSVSSTTSNNSLVLSKSPESPTADTPDSLSASLSSLSLTGNRSDLDHTYNQSFPPANTSHFFYSNSLSMPPAHATMLPTFNFGNQMFLHQAPTLFGATPTANPLIKNDKIYMNTAIPTQLQHLNYSPTLVPWFDQSISCPISVPVERRTDSVTNSKSVNSPETLNCIMMKESTTFPNGVWIPASQAPGTFHVQPINIIHYKPN